MSFFVTALTIHLKRILRSPGVLPVMLLLPIAMLACCLYLSASPRITDIRVGVACSPQNAFARSVIEHLPADRGITFVEYSPEQRDVLRELVETGKLECAYLFADTLGADFAAGNPRQGLVLLKSPQTTADPFATEMIVSAMLSAASLDIAADYLHRSLALPREELRGEVAEIFQGYQDNPERFMRPQEATVEGGGAESAPPPAGQRGLHGLIALFLLCVTGFFLPAFVREKPSVLPALRRGLTARYYGALFCALLCLELLCGLAAVATGRVVYPAGFVPLPAELWALACYAAALSVSGVFLVILLRSDSLLYAGTIFALLLGITVGGAVFDLAELSAQLGGIASGFPTAGYLGGVLLSKPMTGLGVLFAGGTLGSFILIAARRAG